MSSGNDKDCCCDEGYGSYTPPPPPPPPPPYGSGSGSAAGGYTAGCGACSCAGKLLPNQVTVVVTKNDCGTQNLPRCGGVSVPFPTCSRCHSNRCFCCALKNVAPNYSTCEVDQATSQCQTGEFVLDRVGPCAWAYQPTPRACAWNPGASLVAPCAVKNIALSIKSDNSVATGCALQLDANIDTDEQPGACCGQTAAGQVLFGCACGGNIAARKVAIPFAVCPPGGPWANNQLFPRPRGACGQDFSWQVTIN